MATPYLSQEAHDRLTAELEDLKGRGRKEISKEIQVAREHGDLRENAEYHAAKEKQGQMEARITQLTVLLRDAEIGSPDDLGTVQPGLVVTLDIDGDDEVYLVGSREDTHPEHDVLSTDSPLGRAVIGRVVGDTVTVDAPMGAYDATVTAIEAA